MSPEGAAAGLNSWFNERDGERRRTKRSNFLKGPHKTRVDALGCGPFARPRRPGRCFVSESLCSGASPQAPSRKADSKAFARCSCRFRDTAQWSAAAVSAEGPTPTSERSNGNISGPCSLDRGRQNENEVLETLCTTCICVDSFGDTGFFFVYYRFGTL